MRNRTRRSRGINRESTWVMGKLRRNGGRICRLFMRRLIRSTSGRRLTPAQRRELAREDHELGLARLGLADDDPAATPALRGRCVRLFDLHDDEVLLAQLRHGVVLVVGVDRAFDGLAAGAFGRVLEGRHVLFSGAGSLGVS